jgi:hypothetical protein
LKLSQGEVHDFSGEVQKFSGEVQNDLREGAHLLHTSPQNPAMNYLGNGPMLCQLSYEVKFSLKDETV